MLNSYKIKHWIWSHISIKWIEVKHTFPIRNQWFIFLTTVSFSMISLTKDTYLHTNETMLLYTRKIIVTITHSSMHVWSSAAKSPTNFTSAMKTINLILFFYKEFYTRTKNLIHKITNFELRDQTTPITFTNKNHESYEYWI